MRRRLKSTSSSSMDGLTECEANLVVFVHPSNANSVNEAILRELSTLLFTYNETFGGVVLAYDPKVQSNLAKIVPGLSPELAVKLKARLLLFNPTPDMVLEGEVLKITSNSIHAVVLGFSSVFIADEDIREEFKHKSKQGKEYFVSRLHKKHKIKVGSFLRFSVKSFDEELLHITGSLLASHSGCARWLDKNLDKWSQADSSLKKKSEDEKTESDRTVTVKESTAIDNDGQEKKSTKKKRKAKALES